MSWSIACSKRANLGQDTSLSSNTPARGDEGVLLSHCRSLALHCRCLTEGSSDHIMHARLLVRPMGMLLPRSLSGGRMALRG